MKDNPLLVILALFTFLGLVTTLVYQPSGCATGGCFTTSTLAFPLFLGATVLTVIADYRNESE